MISLEKIRILTPLQNLPKNVRDLGKLIVAKGLKKLPKVQKIAQSGHTGCSLTILYGWNCYENNLQSRLMKRDHKRSEEMGVIIAQWKRLCLPSWHPGLNPKHTIYIYLIYSQICAIFACLWNICGQCDQIGWFVKVLAKMLG